MWEITFLLNNYEAGDLILFPTRDASGRDSKTITLTTPRQ